MAHGLATDRSTRVATALRFYAAHWLAWPKRCGVFAVTSAGSLGDQAMTEAVRAYLIDHLQQPCELVVLAGWQAPQLRRACPIMTLDYGSPRRAALQLAGLSGRMRALGMLGADVVDGRYDAESVLFRLAALSTASMRHVPIAVLGASICEHPNANVMDTLRRASSLRFHARDPVSAKRYWEGIGRAPILCADLAFLLKPALESATAREALAWTLARRAGGGRVLGFNVNGLVAKQSEHAEAAYCSALRAHLRRHKDDAVLFLPHDLRPPPNGDIEILGRIHGRLREEFPNRVYVLSPPYYAWDIKALCGELELVITGRMHLAVAALGMGTPSICTVYSGKFEGLFELFGLEDKGLLITPEDVPVPGLLNAKLDAAIGRASGLRQAIAYARPEVMCRAENNFAWLRERG